MLCIFLLSLLVVSFCNASFPAQITPFAKLPRRQQEIEGDKCGYDNAYILSRLSCPQGSSCAAQPSNNVAGGCCRLGDASCILATACIESSSLSASCGSDCQANSYVTKCSNSATPYCYTRYWVSGAVTPSEVGCTTTQGVVAYAYTTYTGFGAEITVNSVTSVIPTPSGSGSGGAVATGEGSAGGQSDGGSGDGDGQSGGGVPAGAIAGGVVGGVAVIGIVAALIVWMVLRHRRQQKSTAAGGTIAASDAGAVGLVSEQKGGNGGPGDGTSFAEQKTANGSVSSPAELSQRDAARPWAPAEGQWHEVPGRSTVPELP